MKSILLTSLIMMITMSIRNTVLANPINRYIKLWLFKLGRIADEVLTGFRSAPPGPALPLTLVASGHYRALRDFELPQNFSRRAAEHFPINHTVARRHPIPAANHYQFTDVHKLAQVKEAFLDSIKLATMAAQYFDGTGFGRDDGQIFSRWFRPRQAPAVRGLFRIIAGLNAD